MSFDGIADSSTQIERLHGAVRHYSWGSRTLIPELCGVGASSEPVAEVWFGAHPLAPASVGEEHKPLDELIEQHPELLGARVHSRFGQLPFLVKLLAADEPLSLQAHPPAHLAEAGFMREERCGLDVSAPQRMFKDRWAKPEMLVALGRFEAFCGLREPASTQQLLATIATPLLEPLQVRLHEVTSNGGDRCWRELLRWLLSLDSRIIGELVAAVVRCCRTAPGPEQWQATKRGIVELGERFPNDPAVLVALLMNHVVLREGEALFVSPGTLHSYVRGLAVEVMATSDNVVRAGLTSKHTDVDTLVDVVDTSVGPQQTQRPAAIAGVREYRVPVEEFEVRHLNVEGTLCAEVGPTILLCTSGSVTAKDLTMTSGDSAFVFAGGQVPQLKGNASVFCVSVPEGSTSARR